MINDYLINTSIEIWTADQKEHAFDLLISIDFISFACHAF